MRRHWRCAASRWRSSATSAAPRCCCGARRAPSDRARPVARARCIVAEAEIALVSRDLNWPIKTLDAAQAALEKHGDRTNAAHARYLAIRRLLLIGRLDAAERLLIGFDPTPLLPASRAGYELVIAGIAMRRLQIKSARAALAQAAHAAHQAHIPSLTAEVEGAARVLDTPAARLISRDEERVLRLDEVESLLASKALIVDACRRAVCHAGSVISLETRPVLFSLARATCRSVAGRRATGRAARARFPRETCR